MLIEVKRMNIYMRRLLKNTQLTRVGEERLHFRLKLCQLTFPESSRSLESNVRFLFEGIILPCIGIFGILGNYCRWQQNSLCKLIAFIQVTASVSISWFESTWNLDQVRLGQVSLVHSHWSRNFEAWLSLVESFIVHSVQIFSWWCYASSLMP